MLEPGGGKKKNKKKGGKGSFNCEEPEHDWRNCPKPLKPELAARLQKEKTGQATFGRLALLTMA